MGQRWPTAALQQSHIAPCSLSFLTSASARGQLLQTLLPLFEGLNLDATRQSGASLCVGGSPLDAEPEVLMQLLPISLSAIRNVLLLRLEVCCAHLLCVYSRAPLPDHTSRGSPTTPSPSTSGALADCLSAPPSARCRLCLGLLPKDLPLFRHATAGVIEVNVDPSEQTDRSC